MSSYFNFLLRKTLGQDPFSKNKPKKESKPKKETKPKAEPKPKKVELADYSSSPGGIAGIATSLVAGIVMLFVFMTVFPAIVASLNTNVLSGNVTTGVGPATMNLLGMMPLVMGAVIAISIIMTVLRLVE